jgi:hypothetical protein
VITAPTSVVGSGTPATVTEAALQNAINKGGQIVFNAGGPVTIPITSALLVKKNCIIDGGGVVTLDGGGSSRVFDVPNTGTQLQLQNMTLQNASTASANLRGGAVYVFQSTFIAINVLFQNNSAAQTGKDVGGGAVYQFECSKCIYSGCTFMNNTGSNGGAIGSLGLDFILYNCNFTNNRATGTGGSTGGAGGAVYIDGVSFGTPNHVFEVGHCVFRGNSGDLFGGGVFCYLYPGSGSSASIDNTTFDSNVLGGMGGLGGGLYVQNETFTLLASTFTNNTCTDLGGGLWVEAGNPATITNCTFTGNKVTSPSNGFGGAIDIVTGDANLTNLTIAENMAANYAGGIFAPTSSSVTVKNCLLQNNTAGSTLNGLNVNRTLTDGGGNVQWPSKRANGDFDTPVTATTVFADALLGPLAANGGPTLTMAIPLTSRAVGAGVAAGAPPIDQRGVLRTLPVDTGAYEAK